MILAGALTLAGITGATAFITETKVAAATQEQKFTKFYSLQTGVVLSKNLFSFKGTRVNNST